MASEAGKGDTYRKQTKDELDAFERSFDRIFRNKEKKFDETVSNGELLDELKEKENVRRD